MRHRNGQMSDLLDPDVEVLRARQMLHMTYGIPIVLQMYKTACE